MFITVFKTLGIYQTRHIIKVKSSSMATDAINGLHGNRDLFTRILSSKNSVDAIKRTVVLLAVRQKTLPFSQFARNGGYDTISQPRRPASGQAGFSVSNTETLTGPPLGPSAAGASQRRLLDRHVHLRQHLYGRLPLLLGRRRGAAAVHRRKPALGAVGLVGDYCSADDPPVPAAVVLLQVHGAQPGGLAARPLQTLSLRAVRGAFFAGFCQPFRPCDVPAWSKISALYPIPFALSFPPQLVVSHLIFIFTAPRNQPGFAFCVMQQVSVRFLQGIKFALLIFMAGHWVSHHLGQAADCLGALALPLV